MMSLRVAGFGPEHGTLGVTERGKEWKTMTFKRCSTRRVIAPVFICIASLSLSSPFPSVLGILSRTLTIFRLQCLKLL